MVTPPFKALEASSPMPENDTQAGQEAGQAAQEAAEDTESQQDGAAQEAEEDEHESTLDPKAKSALEKVRREAANLRKRLKEIEPAARKLKELEDKDKSETQKLNDQLGALQTKITEYEVREVRSAAAAAVGLPATMAQFITASDPAEAKEQAKTLLGFAKAGPPADLKQGARQTPVSQVTGDQLIRRMAGRE